MIGHRFTKYTPGDPSGGGFENLLKLFLQLIVVTSGDVSETLNWMNELDREYNLTDDDYGMGDFIDDLKKNNYIRENEIDKVLNLTVKSERTIRRSSLEEIFSKLRKSTRGNHTTPFSGAGDELTSERREYNFGDTLDQIDVTNSIRNAQINHGLDDFKLTERDLEIEEHDYKSINSTVMMIDMALSELISTKYPKDTLDIIVFGNDAWKISVKDLPYLKVGPFHTNTVAGLDMAVDILRRRKTNNKQIFMITDGKPTCLKIGIKYYKNSFGLDRKIINKTLDYAARCRKLGVTVTTFMIARDPYLQDFVREFTKTNQGRAYYSSLDGLGDFIFEDYIRNRRKHLH